jgi:hypothetical protein
VQRLLLFLYAAALNCRALTRAQAGLLLHHPATALEHQHVHML